MLDTFKALATHQYDAALCTLHACVEGCPDRAWDEPIANLAFCQVVFHALFFADVYLGPDLESLRRQPFHREHAGDFGDYEELQDRKQENLYDRPFIRRYLEHCRAKASAVIAAETAESLRGPTGFERRDFSRAELHVFNIRHLQHHAAQLILRLRRDHEIDTPWFGSGWREVHPA